MESSWVTTTLLLKRLEDFQDSAWLQFEARFRRPLLKYARQVGLTSAEAEDFSQEVLLAFADGYRSGAYQRNKGLLRGWLFRIAHHKAVDSIRNRGRGPRPTPQDGDPPADLDQLPEVEAEVCWQQVWEESLMTECLEQIRREVHPTTFEAFERTALRQESPADVAEQLSLSRNAVFLAKHRIIRRLRLLQQEYDAQD
jgi:RNA polymerase sigma-70 factor (ECF subfamily)